MKAWIKISLLLCLFGFLKEFRPSEPFIVDFLTSPRMNITNEVISEDLFPIGIYANVGFLLVVLLVTDLLRYKAVIIVEGIAGATTWALLSFCTSYIAMQMVEVFYGLFNSTEVAYFTYIYARVDRKHYQKVTSHTRAAYLLGRSLSATLGQVFVSTAVMNSHQLNFISFGCLCLATVWALGLPPVKQGLYFHRGASGTINSVVNDDTDRKTSLPQKKSVLQNAFLLLWRDFKKAYTNMYVVKWSIWWALATCGYLQIITYVQVMYDTILEESGEKKNELYNGVTDALSTLLGAAASFACGWLNVDWRHRGEIVLALCSLLEAAALFVTSVSETIWLAYACYILFIVVYNAMFTVTNAEVAKNINEDSYGLIFGSNMLFSMVLLTIFTVVVMSSNGLALQSRQQYMVYGSYFAILGVVFGVMAIYTRYLKCHLKK